MRPDAPVAVGVAVVVLALAWCGAAPSVSFHDSGEFALAAQSGGIPHPPGAPLWSMLAWAFVSLGGFSNTAYGANLFSGLCGAVAAGALSFLSMRIVRESFRDLPGFAVGAAGIVAGSVLAGGGAFLEQCFVAEQYTLMLAAIAVFWVVQWEWRARRDASRAGIALCVATGAVAALATANHPSQVVLLAAAMVWIPVARLRRRWSEAAAWKRTAAELAATFGGAVAGSLAFLWLPLRSRAQPLMDWGNPETFARVLRGLGRDAWPSRPIADAPPGLVTEWIATYRLPAELGVAGLVLAVAGLVWAALRCRRALLLLLAVVVPYAAGMLVGHLKQGGVDHTYVTQYGLRDWHLPLYGAGAVLAGLGAAWAVSRAKSGLRPAVAAVLVAAGLVGAGLGFHRESLAGWTDPEDYVEAVLSNVPGDDAALLVFRDTTNHMLAWSHYRRGAEPAGRWYGYGLAPVPMFVDAAVRREGGWNGETQRDYLTRVAVDPGNQPLNVDPLDDDAAANVRLFCDYGYIGGRGVEWLLPRGFLLEVMRAPVTEEDIRSAEAAWRTEHPDLLAPPQGLPHRLTRDAWTNLHMARGDYFDMRGLSDLAAESYALATQWNPQRWDAHEQLGKLYLAAGNDAAAAKSFEAAVAAWSHAPDSLLELGVLRAIAGDLQGAEAFLRRLADAWPENEAARHNLELVRKQRAAEGR